MTVKSLTIDAAFLATHSACRDWSDAVADALPITVTDNLAANELEAQRVLAVPSVAAYLRASLVRGCHCFMCEILESGESPPPWMLPIAWLMSLRSRLGFRFYVPFDQYEPNGTPGVRALTWMISDLSETP